MKVEIYSDVVCPWCYIGDRRFTRALDAFGGADDVEVVYRAYQLDPEAPRKAVPLENYLTSRYGPAAPRMMEQVGAAAAGEGIEMNWDSALVVNTMTAHRLLSLAEREYGSDVQRALLEKLFDYHFTRGGDLSDRDALADLASGVGMDPERVRAYLDSDQGMREVERDVSEAGRLGIRAVPTFVFERRYAVQGAQPTPVFLQALEEVQAQLGSAVAAEGGAEARDDRLGET